MLGETGKLCSHNIYAYCGNNPVMYSDPSGRLFLSALIFIGISALVGAGTGALIAASDGGDATDIAESALEGFVLGATAATIGYSFSPVVAFCVGTGTGAVVDTIFQGSSYYSNNGTLEGFKPDAERLIESAITTGIGAAIPTFSGTKEKAAIAIGSAIAAADASIVISVGTVIRHQIKNNYMMAFEERR